MQKQISGIHPSAYDSVFQPPITWNLQWGDARRALSGTGEARDRTNLIMETVVTAIVASAPAKHENLLFPIPVTYSSLRFSVRCCARQVYLLIGDKDGTAIALHQMQQAEEDRWDVSVRLKEGPYRYRYYANQGNITMCAMPDEADDAPIRMEDFPLFTFSGNGPVIEPATNGYPT